MWIGKSLTAAIAVTVAAAAMADTGFKSVWSADASPDARRIAVADLAGDGKQRVILLGKGSSADIYAIDDTKLKKEESVDLGAKPEMFVAGKFAKGKHAIVAPGVYVLRQGEKYSRKECKEIEDITGVVKFVNGKEGFFHLGQGSPVSHGLDPAAEKPVVEGDEMPDPMSGEGTYAGVAAHLPAEFTAHFSLAPEAQVNGLLGFIAEGGKGKLQVFSAWNKDGGHFALYDMSVIGEGKDAPMPQWTSPKLAGKVIDITIGVDPKEGKQLGLYILQEANEGKGRKVEFFAMGTGK